MLCSRVASFRYIRPPEFDKINQFHILQKKKLTIIVDLLVVVVLGGIDAVEAAHKVVPAALHGHHRGLVHAQVQDFALHETVLRVRHPHLLPLEHSCEIERFFLKQLLFDSSSAMGASTQKVNKQPSDFSIFHSIFCDKIMIFDYLGA